MKKIRKIIQKLSHIYWTKILTCYNFYGAIFGWIKSWLDLEEKEQN